ncbi:MAG: sigma-70 family RNA polymerase sigma factor [Candidatus Caenarcaniphilales bacterium]|nr:sigma-70 family RNA polymerase sigma factor [Candidatus Caenarcaniphilales bacterium]
MKALDQMETIKKAVRPDLDTDIVHALLAEYRAKKDPNAKDQIIKHCMILVKRIANNLARRSTDSVEDLIQVGCIGLIKAIENFDPTAGAKCTTYFTHLIAGEMRHYCRDKAMLFRAPRELVELNFRINRMVQALTYEFGREPTDAELAEALEVDSRKIQEAYEVERRRTLISLDQTLSTDNSDDQIFLDTLVDGKYQNFARLQEHKLVLQDALNNISPMSREIVEEIFLNEQTQASYAKKHKISQMQTSRRLRSALAELRRYFHKIGQNQAMI